LGLGKGFGNPGLLLNAVSFFGWSLIIDVGRQIGFNAEVCLAQLAALYVTKHRKPLITS